MERGLADKENQAEDLGEWPHANHPVRFTVPLDNLLLAHAADAERCATRGRTGDVTHARGARGFSNFSLTFDAWPRNDRTSHGHAPPPERRRRQRLKTIAASDNCICIDGSRLARPKTQRGALCVNEGDPGERTADNTTTAHRLPTRPSPSRPPPCSCPSTPRTCRRRWP